MTHCDIGLITHSHFDNNAYEMLDAGMILRGMGGKYSFADVKITGLLDKHIAETESPVYTREVMEVLYPFPNVAFEDRDNTIYVLETGGLKIVHWGHNRQNPPEDIWDSLRNVDIAILPVTDDGRQLTPEWADKIAEKMNAKVVIPCHYFIEGINIENHGWGKTAEEYTLSKEHTVLQEASVTVNPESIKNYKQHVMYFGGVVNFEKLELSTAEMTSSPAKVPGIKPVWENV
jgi:L-ascorbate metabolism protein UlaG (beta-lactamase superfamily)